MRHRAIRAMIAAGHQDVVIAADRARRREIVKEVRVVMTVTSGEVAVLLQAGARENRVDLVARGMSAMPVGLTVRSRRLRERPS